MNNPNTPEDPSQPPPPSVTRPPVGKPKLKLTPKSGKKLGTKPSLKMSGKKPVQMTQPPFKKAPQLTPNVSNDESTDEKSGVTPPLSPLPTSSLDLGEDNKEKVSESPNPHEQTGVSNEPPVSAIPPAPPILEKVEGVLPPPPSLGESSSAEDEETKDAEGQNVDGDVADSNEPPVSAIPPAPPILEKVEGVLPSPPLLGESKDSSEVGKGTGFFNSSSDENLTDNGPELQSSSNENLPVNSEESNDAEKSAPPESEDQDDLEGLEQEGGDQEKTMTPFEISESFRNLKINIMMVKGKLKEISENDQSDVLTSLNSQIETLETKFLNSEEKREENKKIILSLVDEIQDFKKKENKESSVEIDHEIFKETTQKLDALISDKESTLELINSLKEKIENLELKINESEKKSTVATDNSTLEDNILEIFDKIDDINSDKSEFKSKIANIESKLEDEVLGTNEEIPPPPPSEDPSSSGLSTRVEDLEDIINDATSAIHELSEEFHSFQDETKEFNEKSSPSSENPENFSELEKTINEIRSQMDDLSVEPPPPPPISESSSEESNQELIDTVQNLEKRMSNFHHQLQSEIDELKGADSSESNVVNSEMSNADKSDSGEDSKYDDKNNEDKVLFDSDSSDEIVVFEVISNGNDSNPIVRIGKFEKSYAEWYDIWQLTIPKTDLENEVFNYVSKSKEFEELHWKLLGL